MNQFYASWLQIARTKAEAKGLAWNPPFNPETGKIEKSQRWALRAAIGLPPPEIWLSSFAHVDSDIAALGELSQTQRFQSQPRAIMAPDWREFLQAAVANELLVKRNKVAQAVAVGRAIRTLSLCASATAPWDLTPEDVQRAYNVALRCGTSGKLAMNVVMVVRCLFDNEHLGHSTPLAHFATPYPDASSGRGQAAVERQRGRENSNYNVHSRRSQLADRKASERLPEQQAFWELVRIIFTETPLTFTDRIRFGALRMHLLAGTRIGEAVLFPENCLRWRDYFDIDGARCGEKGGISRSLSLRYFALKQDDEHGDQVRLVEQFQEIPPIFEEMVVEIVEEISGVTAPLRKRLKAQTETGRLIPEYEPDALVGAIEMYARVAGSIRTTELAITDDARVRYRATHSVEALAAIREEQQRASAHTSIRPVAAYWRTQKSRPPARDRTGRRIVGSVDYRTAYFRVSEVEDFIRREMPTKLSDTEPFIGPDGEPVYPYELLFLHPPRSLIEGRNGGVIDIERYFSVGRISSNDLVLQLSSSQNSLFTRYGETDEDKSRSLLSHSTRHVQTTELFRLGIADTIITKRFNRKSTAQSYTYDHRSLVEALSAIDLPPAAQTLVPERTRDTLKLILAGKARGPIVEEFLAIQKQYGDDEAFRYLAAEADGFHATPYGLCLNSFTVSPCPKHLQCFNGCIYLARTDNPDEEHHLGKVRERTSAALAIAEASPTLTPGRKNQIAHANTLLTNIDVAIATAPGMRVFPNGQDLSQPIGKPATVIDAALSARRAP